MNKPLSGLPEFKATLPASPATEVDAASNVSAETSTAEPVAGVLMTQKRDWVTPLLVGALCLTLGMLLMLVINRGSSPDAGPVPPSEIESVCELEIKQWAANKAAVLRNLADMTDAGRITDRSQYQANKREQLKQAMIAAVAENDQLENRTLPETDWASDQNQFQASRYMRSAADGYERAAQ